jgi:hypothetical protein
MTWETLNDVRNQTKVEFVPELAKRHCYVRLSSGRWTRTLGPPDPQTATHVRGNVYQAKVLS